MVHSCSWKPSTQDHEQTTDTYKNMDESHGESHKHDFRWKKADPKRTCALWVYLPQVQQLDRLICVSGIGRVVILWSWGAWLGGYDSLLGSWGREGWECCVSWVKVLVAYVFGLQNFMGCNIFPQVCYVLIVYLNIFMGSCIVQTRLDSRESSKINGEETLPIMRRGIRRPNG